MENKGNTKEKLRTITERDPLIARFITDIRIFGIERTTKNRTVILIYENPKTNIMAILDPWTENLTITDTKQRKTKINIPIKQAIKILEDLYGTPQITEIPKFGTNIPMERLPRS